LAYSVASQQIAHFFDEKHVPSKRTLSAPPLLSNT
jgi:hypothetical protein